MIWLLNPSATDKFLEDYRVTDLGNGSCRVEWYMAIETRGFSRHMMWMTRPLMGFANRRMFKKFSEYTENYAAQLQSDSLEVCRTAK